MSYTPTNWQTGDTITANKLNKIETELVALDSDIGDLKSDFDIIATIEDILSVNVLNLDTMTRNGYLNSSGEVIGTDTNYGYSDYIKVNEGDTVRFYRRSQLDNNPGCLYYSDGTIANIKSATGYTQASANGEPSSFTVPANVKRIRINVRWGYLDEYMVTINNAWPSSYVPYKSVNKINEDVLVPANFLFGKKWAACGDSITYGSAADVDAQGNRKTYAYYVAKRNNMDLTVDAVAGSTLADVTGKSGFSVDRYKNLPADLDYITIFFGINDSGSDVPIGDISDATNETFYGAWNVVLQYLIEHYPTTKIGVVVNYGGSDSYRNATRAICTKYGIVPFDIMGSDLPLFAGRESGVNGAISDARKATFLADGTHPNNAGYIYMSTYFEQYLHSL